MTAESIEYEHGVAIPGQILPQSEWAKSAVKRLPEAGPLDWPAIFGRTAPIVLDLGCGNGRFTLMSAVNRPKFDHFAIDFVPVVIRYATRRANQRGLHNVRFAVKDAQTFMGRYVGPSSVTEIHVYHPQPYHDPRKAFLRVLTPRLLVDAYNALVADGLFVVQTDNPDYWDYMTCVLPSFFEFAEHPEPWPDAPEGRTRREMSARITTSSWPFSRKRTDSPSEIACCCSSLNSINGASFSGIVSGAAAEQQGRGSAH